VSDFRPRSETELAQMSFEDLLAYHREARELGRNEEARAALGILIWGIRDRVEFWVRRKAPHEEVEDLVGQVMVDVVRGRFDSDTKGQFLKWVKQIAERRVADYHRRLQRRPAPGPLAEEHEEDEDIFGAVPETPDPTGALIERSIVEQALGELTDVHRRVVELGGPEDMGFEQRPAKEVAEMVNDQFGNPAGDSMTNVNVHKIVSRFRARIERLARPADDDPAGG
jgi:RNA polymerase sigma factor (sigma-70 family)